MFTYRKILPGGEVVAVDETHKNRSPHAYTITKDFHFSASHQLDGLPEGHPCSRLHGHNYIVRVGLSSELLDTSGFVWDYGNLGFVGEFLDNTWDHRHLNDVVDFDPPTAELIARHLALMVSEHTPGHVHVTVSVSETPKTWATYRT